jgi:ABC-2 type transport system permease protein
MRSVLALAARILKQMGHDPRTIVQFIAAPIVVLWLLSVILGASAYRPTIATVNLPSDVQQAIAAQDCTATAVSAQEGNSLINSQAVDAVVSVSGQSLTVELEGANAAHNEAVVRVMQAALQQSIASERASAQAELNTRLSAFSQALAALPPAALQQLAAQGLSPQAAAQDLNTQLAVTSLNVQYLHGSPDWNGFAFYGPVLIGVFLFTFVFITSGMSLVTERTGGTMERLLATPMRSWQLVGGYLVGFGAMSLVQAAIVLAMCIWVVGFPNVGNLGLVILIALSMAFVSLALGLLASSLARTAFQVVQLLLLLVVPQILLSGIFSLAGAPAWMQVLSRCFPVTYGASALRDVMLRGAGWAQVGGDVAVLWAFLLVFCVLATLSYRRRRNIITN